MANLDFEGLQYFKAKENAMLASAYSASKTYAVGDYVMSYGVLYKCNTAITVAEAWTPAHWTAVKLAEDVSNVKSALKEENDNLVEITTHTERNNASWAVGSYAVATGAASGTNHARLRLIDFIGVSYGIVGAECKTGYDMAVYAWDKTTGNYVGALRTDGTFSNRSGASDLLFVHQFLFTAYPDYNFHVVLAKAPDYTTEMSTTDSVNCLYLVGNDYILEKSEFTDWVLGYSVTTNVSIDTEVDVTPIETNGWGYQIIPTVKDGIYVITGLGGNNARLYCFTDSAYIAKAVASSGVNYTNREVIAPCDGYLIVNVHTNQDYSLEKKTKLNLKDAFNDIADINGNIDSVEEDVGSKVSKTDLTLLEQYGYSNNVNDISIWEQGYINSSTGALPAAGTLMPKRIRTPSFISSDVKYVAAKNGFIAIYKYDKTTGNFDSVGSAIWLKSFNGFDHDTYNYRLAYSLTATSPWYDVTPESSSDILILTQKGGNTSAFKKNIAWGEGFALGWYSAQGTDYSYFNRSTLYAELVEAYDALVAGGNGYITKESLGQASDGQQLYLYTLMPTWFSNKSLTDGRRPPIIYIFPSQHGYEKSAAFGTYYFVRDLVQNASKDPALMAIRARCVIKVIPCANPYGFDNNTRKNAPREGFPDGVDLNRNWGVNNDDDPGGTGGSTDPYSAYYGGVAPFDQPETQAMKAQIDAQPNLFYVIDYHTNGEYSAANWENFNWISMRGGVTSDPYYNYAYHAGISHLCNISTNIPMEFNIDTQNAPIGKITLGSDESPTIGGYLFKNSLMGHTFEGNNGLPGGTAYDSTEQKINSELLGNYIAALLCTFSKVS